MPKKTSRGFTLIELMVVIAVMGAIIVISVGSFITAQLKARDARRKNDLAQISKAIELYYNDHGRYPPASSGRIAGCGSSSQSACPATGPFTDQYGTIYMDTIPTERTTGNNYVYRVDTAGLRYQLFARLENLNDQAVDFNRDGVADQYTGVSCGTQTCNFAITSPNTNGSTTLN